MISVERFIELLKEHNLWICDQSINADTMISGKPVTDSRQIQSGDVFICIKGLQSDGHNYIKQARATGVAVIVQENDFTDNLPAIRVKDSRKAAALLSKLYFNNPSGKFKLIGVTGTNGKTTISMLIWQALTEMGYKTGWIGTLGYRIDSDIIETNNTTPDILELNGILNQMVKAECSYVVMEVSSHAMALDRVYGLEFDLAIFSNLSRDHLDYHIDMQDYFECKYLLFKNTIENGGRCIINIDDEYGRTILNRNEINHREKLITISEIKADITILNQTSSLIGSEVDLELINKSQLKLSTKLVGHYNILNLVMAVIAIKTLVPDTTNVLIERISTSLNPVRGRLERVPTDTDRAIFVDYAHTPDALKNVLSTLKKLPHRRLLVVFGAGGDRDKGKRSEMLREVLIYSDAAIITDDNPRYENPNQIIREIIGDNNLWKPWWIIRDRKKAIHSILLLSDKDDIVLIAGKGHETYQEIEGIKYPCDDVKIATEAYNTKLELDGVELFLPVHPIMLEALYGSSFTGGDTNALKDEYKYISTDSRTIQPESIYFAIKGEVFDGHKFIDSVIEDNSCCAVISDQSIKKPRTIGYADTQLGLGLLAKKYLQMFSLNKIALTGSTGKTTTKEYLANIFSTTGNVLKTLANENNILGLSKTIFRIRPEDKTAVFELGTNHFGEINSLADICNTDVGIITNIGPSHLEFLEDEDGVYKEKTDLFRREISTIIYPGDDKRFLEFEAQGKSVGYTPGCTYQIKNVVCQNQETRFSMNGIALRIPQQLPFYVENIAFAVATAIESGLSEQDIQSGLLKPLDLKLRMEIKQIKQWTFIFDCYNANPVSMKAAIEFWGSYNPDYPHIAILGDMLELGDKSIEYHKSIGSALSDFNYQFLYTVGDLSRYYHNEKIITSSPPITDKHFSIVDELLKEPIVQSLPENAIILVKASHGIHLEKIYDLFTQISSQKVSNNAFSSKE